MRSSIPTIGVFGIAAIIAISLFVCLGKAPTGSRYLDVVLRAKESSGVELPFDGVGYRRYENCLASERKYAIVEDIFEKCAIPCSSVEGCPKGCCFNALDGNQFLVCSMSGKCLRAGGNNMEGQFLALEYIGFDDSFSGRLVCPLQSLKYGDPKSSCALRSEEFTMRDRPCPIGISVPNTGQLSHSVRCTVGKDEELPLEEVPTGKEVDPPNIISGILRKTGKGST